MGVWLHRLELDIRVLGVREWDYMYVLFIIWYSDTQYSRVHIAETVAEIP